MNDVMNAVSGRPLNHYQHAQVNQVKVQIDSATRHAILLKECRAIIDLSKETLTADAKSKLCNLISYL